MYQLPIFPVRTPKIGVLKKRKCPGSPPELQAVEMLNVQQDGTWLDPVGPAWNGPNILDAVSLQSKDSL